MTNTEPEPKQPVTGEVRQFQLGNQSGFEVVLLDYGAAIQSIRVPTPGGQLDAILGYDEPADYLETPYFMGSTQGRYANRIENARLKLEDRVHKINETADQGGHSLHGGPAGFSRRFWQAEPSHCGQEISFKLLSADGDQGFPGRVSVTVSYRLLGDFGLVMDYRASTEATTVISLANHAYFNLNTDDSPVDNHHVMINADYYTPMKENHIPSGEIRSVASSLFDFREPAELSNRLDFDNEQIRIGKGFDHNFVLNGAEGSNRLAAKVWSPQSSLRLKVLTTQAGLQLYTGQYLDEPFQAGGGLCLEAQGFPNAPNTPNFPSTVLRPGMNYHQRTIYEFSIGDLHSTSTPFFTRR